VIRIDISRAIPPRLGTYLLGIIPGVFFEGSVAIGNPRFAVSVLSRVRDIYPFGPYTLLVLFLTSGLIIGQGFFLAAWIADLVITSAFALWRYVIRNTFGSPWLYRWFGKLQGIPPKRNSFIRWLGRVVFWARGREFSSAARPVLKCLYVAVQRLLRVRYGIERRFGGQWDDGEWGVWYSVLGKPLTDFKEASLSSRTYLGCGLAGFAALYASPTLRVRYFVALCIIFTFAGCFSSVDLARWKFNPVRRSMARLRSVLLELSEASTMTGKPNGDSENGSSGSIDTNEGD
jgi:hypothetical protein